MAPLVGRIDLLHILNYSTPSPGMFDVMYVFVVVWQLSHTGGGEDARRNVQDASTSSDVAGSGWASITTSALGFWQQ